MIPTNAFAPGLRGKPATPSAPSLTVSDEYWSTWPGAALPYSWDGSEWSHPSTNLEVWFGLVARSDGPPGAWIAGIREATCRVTINSGVDEGNFGFTGGDIYLYNSAGAQIGSQGFSFGGVYGIDIMVDITIDNAANLDYERIEIECFIYNTAPLIRNIEFIT